ncbi:5765_t:CDS:2 [Acaulospora colombiana]|uniref:5765_t:CDS:1 n=1 Tax=Acaulospora colombiana TaxID=27376 RepID=A0ACA9MRS5_9GLOM|nr:5765_t:CDS:2 [Acaulospora colombiana]
MLVSLQTTYRTLSREMNFVIFSRGSKIKSHLTFMQVYEILYGGLSKQFWSCHPQNSSPNLGEARRRGCALCQDPALRYDVRGVAAVDSQVIRERSYEYTNFLYESPDTKHELNEPKTMENIKAPVCDMAHRE